MTIEEAKQKVHDLANDLNKDGLTLSVIVSYNIGVEPLILPPKGKVSTKTGKRLPGQKMPGEK